MGMAVVPRHGLLILLFSLLLRICSATRFIPRLNHVAPRSEAFMEIHNVMIKPRHDYDARSVLIPREWDSDSLSPAESQSPFAAVKRTLLGRQSLTCDPGYALCEGEICNMTFKEQSG